MKIPGTTKTCPQCGTVYEQDIKFCPRDGSALRGRAEDGSLIGQVVADRYEVLQRLGAGAMGEVYLAEHVKMGRPSAIKVMNRRLAADPEAVARFNREAANASRINNPNVAAIYDFGETSDGLIFLAMEYIDGESLTDLIDREGPLGPGRAAAIARQIAEALIAAHDLGIIHRDLKPDNIMIARTRDGRDMVKVVDFGIAKATLATGQEVTRTGFVVGTPEYMSPEQFVGIGVDARSDVFAVGCILYKMLTGQLAYASRQAEGSLRNRVGEPPPRPSDANPRVPKTLDAIVMRALAFEPDDRFQAASELRDALVLEQDSPSQTRRAIRIVRVSRRAWFATGVAAALMIIAAIGANQWGGLGHMPDDAADGTAREPAAAAAPAAGSVVRPPVDTATPLRATEPRETRPATPASDARRADSVARSERELLQAQRRALDARSRALAARVPSVELDAGASHLQRADRLIAARRLSAAVLALAEAEQVWEDAARRARIRAESTSVPAPPPARPVVSVPTPAAPPVAVAPAPVDPMPEVRSVLARYARALESRDVAQLRQAYAGITAVEERRWRDVFDATDRVGVALTISRVAATSADSVVALVDAAYVFEFRRGISGDREPRATYTATFRRGSDGWRLASLR